MLEVEQSGRGDEGGEEVSLIKALLLTALIIGGVFVFPVFASVAIIGGDWSHVGAAALAVALTVTIGWLADGKLK